MAYYISFLKTLSLKLNNHTVHFFYNEVRCLVGTLETQKNPHWQCDILLSLNPTGTASVIVLRW